MKRILVKKKFLLWLALVVILLLLANKLLDHEEKFLIKDYSVYLFAVDSFSKEGKYYKVHEIRQLSKDSMYDVIVGIQLHLDYISWKTDGLATLFGRYGSGYEGHIDTMEKVSLVDAAGKDLSACIYDTLPTQYISMDSMQKYLPYSSATLNGVDCINGNVVHGLEGLRQFYNSTNWDKPELTDIFLFRLNKNLCGEIKDSLQVKIEMRK